MSISKVLDLFSNHMHRPQDLLTIANSSIHNQKDQIASLESSLQTHMTQKVQHEQERASMTSLLEICGRRLSESQSQAQQAHAMVDELAEQVADFEVRVDTQAEEHAQALATLNQRHAHALKVRLTVLSSPHCCLRLQKGNQGEL